jgi:hypothetical protein
MKRVTIFFKINCRDRSLYKKQLWILGKGGALAKQDPQS